jgi:transcriptional regulator with XRE-family HTH domain
VNPRRIARAERSGFQVIGFGDRLRATRTERGISQLELAEAVGQSQAQVSKWEREVQLPSIDNLGRVAQALRTSSDTLLGLESARARRPAHSRKAAKPISIGITKTLTSHTLASGGPGKTDGAALNWRTPDEPLRIMPPKQRNRVAGL